ILGGFIPSMLSGIQIGLEYTSAISLEGQQADKIFRVQEMFDNIAPYLVPIGLVAGLLWLIKKKNMTSIQILILIFVLAAVCYFTKLLIVA
ncbi:PTS system mannose/fructose/sorbose family transporter subunit IID, partial [Holdemania filiformis]